MARLGMDDSIVENVANQLIGHVAEQINSVITNITSLVHEASGAWDGPDAVHFQGDWDSAHRPNLQAIHDAVVEFGNKAKAEVEQQRQASGA